MRRLRHIVTNRDNLSLRELDAARREGVADFLRQAERSGSLPPCDGILMNDRYKISIFNVNQVAIGAGITQIVSDVSHAQLEKLADHDIQTSDVSGWSSVFHDIVSKAMEVKNYHALQERLLKKHIADADMRTFNAYANLVRSHFHIAQPGGPA
jgi:hypothetical protein